MTAIWFDGFGGAEGSFVEDAYTSSSSTLETGVMSARRADCLALALDANTIDRSIAAATEIVAGVAYQCTLGTQHVLVGLREGSTTHLSVVVGTAGEVKAYLGDAGGTLLDTADAAYNLRSGVPAYIEVEAKIDNSAGYVRVYVDDALACEFSGDTRNGGTNGVVDNVRLGGTTDALVADYYVIDPTEAVAPTERLGPTVQVDALEPSSIDARDWSTTGAATQLAAIADTEGIDGDTSYVSTGLRRSTADIRFAAIAADATTGVYAVRAAVTMRRYGTGTRDARVELSHYDASTRTLMASQYSSASVNTSYELRSLIYPDSADREIAADDVGMFRLRVTGSRESAASNELRVTAARLHVLRVAQTSDGGSPLAQVSQLIVHVFASGEVIPAQVSQLIVHVFSSGSLDVIDDTGAGDGLAPGEAPTFVAEIQYADENGDTQTALVTDGAGWATGASDTPANTVVHARLAQPANFERVIFTGAATFGAVEASYGDAQITNRDAAFDAWAGYAVSGHRFKLMAGRDGSAYPSTWRTVLDTTMQSIEADLSRIVIRLRDDLEVLRRARLRDPSVADPVVYGSVFSVRPVLIDSATLEYAVGRPPSGCIVVVQSLRDNGVPLRHDSGGAFDAGSTVATEEGVATASVSAGSYNWHAGSGRLRVGSKPAGVLTATLFVCASSASPWAPDASCKVGTILAQMATAAGIDASQIDPVGQADLDEASGDTLYGYWDDGAISTLEAMERVSNSIGAWFGFDRLARLRMQQFSEPDDTAAVWRFTHRNILENTLERIVPEDATRGVPVWRVVARAARNYAPSDALAGAVTPTDKALLQVEWPVQVAAESASVLDVAPTAAELVIDVYSGGYGAGNGRGEGSPENDGNEAQRRLTLYAGVPEMVRLTTWASTALLTTVDIGKTVILEYARYGWGAAWRSSWSECARICRRDRCGSRCGG